MRRTRFIRVRRCFLHVLLRTTAIVKLPQARSDSFLVLWPRDSMRNAVGENANRDRPGHLASSNRIPPSTQRCRIELTEYPAAGRPTRWEKTTVSPMRKRRGSMRNVTTGTVYIPVRHARCQLRRAEVPRVIKSHIAINSTLPH